MPDVRRGRADDLSTVIALGGPSEEVPGWLDAGALRVAELDGRVVGFAVVEPTFFGHEFVVLVRVADDARRRGAARALLQAIDDDRATEKVFTSTNLSNAPMQEVLRQLGWESSGIVYGLDEGDPELFYRAPPGG
ncbi:GNAT family N-acetyltransferase [Cellulomonas sp. Leaf334]|uniref:GNAT family N-acetyltransferase n=1 Tax=Cellulomonas sp. Leaf334 TaxID=1736339 RepID=UPI0006F559F9|nr:GNAT family N-acetyltransferase [Cellulomonas sp. Leaf334]KQR10358.1 hypothetical protein ASF78_16845 [Cellulomonas sp. Leaf334]